MLQVTLSGSLKENERSSEGVKGNVADSSSHLGYTA